MAAGNTGGDPLEKVLIAIGMVREEIAGLRTDLIGKTTAAIPVGSPTRVSAAAGQGAPLKAAYTSSFKPVMLRSERYLVNLNTGHAYQRKENGSQGEWAGIFHRTGGPKGGPWVNSSVPEPNTNEIEGGKRKFTRKHKRRHMKTRKH